ncbi:hypothetical protein C8A01DRAFT_35005 [Parachaetomium inaequale]|uniref:Uncharacterized protein n=1 Tax=Parachaetomium inaequale TaxID=2588326 RepID=A0AAN6PKX0_9PEZI|nr:hypothetical protein C8A01DRAFT_35005 [Parachaetomium inaequale]
MAPAPGLDSEQYEIRQLQPGDTDAASAILSVATAFDSPFFELMVQYQAIPKPARVYALFDTHVPVVSRHIESGLSYGVFNKHYISPRGHANPSSVLWACPDTRDEAPTKIKLLSQIDSPLVSVALSNDATDPQYFDGAGNWIPPAIRELCELKAMLRQLDTAPPKLWQPTERGQMLLREGTFTRSDYAGRGLAKALSYWLMDEMARQGYRTIEVDTYHPAVTKIWQNPPAPFAASVGCELLPGWSDTIAGKVLMGDNVLVDRLCVECKRIYVSLVPDAGEAGLEALVMEGFS